MQPRSVIAQGTVWVYKSNRCLFLERGFAGKGEMVYMTLRRLRSIGAAQGCRWDFLFYGNGRGNPFHEGILAKVYWSKARTSLRVGTAHKFSKRSCFGRKIVFEPGDTTVRNSLILITWQYAPLTSNFYVWSRWNFLRILNTFTRKK